MLAYYLHTMSPFLWEIRPGFGLRWYGLSYVLAFYCGYLLYYRLSKKGYSQIPPDQVSDFITLAAVFGVLLGGRLGWVLFYGLQQESHDHWYWPVEVWSGGMASHGGILGLLFFTLWYAKKHHYSWTSIGDSLCVVAPVGLFFVRCANFINGELYGHPTNVPWAVQFASELREKPELLQKAIGNTPLPDDPNAIAQMADATINLARHDPSVADRLREILPARHPSQLYEALLEGVVLFSILWFMRTKLRVPRGVISGAFFICYALLRILGEVFRIPDPAWHMGPFSAGQFLSLFMILIGAAFIFYGYKYPEYEKAQE
jgi:phosphatidylglycerol:prolipoprotein diacylglycerol transferase